jgi:Spy/CpxP family protein refolding chaperone
MMSVPGSFSVSRLAFASILLVTLATTAAGAQAQGRAAQRGVQPADPAAAPGVSPGEIQQMFDAYVLVQAQDVLQLKDDQYAQFVTRLRALQAVRRRNENQRLTLVNQLRRILQAGDKANEGMIKERLKTLSDLNASALTEARQAQDSLDEVLDLRQQARFRIFEEEMERRKVELVMRTRQANRQANRPRNEFQE